jgi:hypothetical protein
MLKQLLQRTMAKLLSKSINKLCRKGIRKKSNAKSWHGLRLARKERQNYKSYVHNDINKIKIMILIVIQLKELFLCSLLSKSLQKLSYLQKNISIYIDYWVKNEILNYFKMKSWRKYSYRRKDAAENSENSRRGTSRFGSVAFLGKLRGLQLDCCVTSLVIKKRLRDIRPSGRLGTKIGGWYSNNCYWNWN